MLIYKDGITRHIRRNDWQHYKELGFVEVEATPVEDELPEVPQDDEVEATPKNKRNKRGN